MSAPAFITKTAEEFELDRQAIVEEIHPLTIEYLKELRAADAITDKLEDLLERYETLTWLIEG